MLRVVHVITRFVNGGADENTLLTCNRQAEAGHRVWLVHGDEFTERMTGLLDPKVNVVELSSLTREVSLFRDMAALGSLARLFRRVDPHVIHTHTSKAGIVGRLASFAVPRAKVVHGVHILPFTSEPFAKRMVYLGLEKLAALRTDAFIDVSEGMRDLCLAHSLGSDANHFVIRSGMDVDRFRHALPADDIAALRGSAEGTLIVGYVAVLERRKRHRELLQAMLPLLERHTQACLVMAGDGPERRLLEQMIAERGLSHRVRILGFREDVERVLAACDVCVFTSQREGLPRSVVQYAIAGKPVVATWLPGIDRVIRHEENGYVVPSDDFDAFAGKVETLVLDERLRKTFAAASAAADLSDWNASVMAERIEQVYRMFLGSGPNPDIVLAADGD
ncbi:MAG: glycosyltransferase family 4 protein [Parvibaculum sp.]